MWRSEIHCQLVSDRDFKPVHGCIPCVIMAHVITKRNWTRIDAFLLQMPAFWRISIEKSHEQDGKRIYWHNYLNAFENLSWAREHILQWQRLNASKWYFSNAIECIPNFSTRLDHTRLLHPSVSHGHAVERVYQYHFLGAEIYRNAFWRVSSSIRSQTLVDSSHVLLEW